MLFLTESWRFVIYPFSINTLSKHLSRIHLISHMEANKGNRKHKVYYTSISNTLSSLHSHPRLSHPHFLLFFCNKHSTSHNYYSSRSRSTVWSVPRLSIISLHLFPPNVSGIVLKNLDIRSLTTWIYPSNSFYSSPCFLFYAPGPAS